MKKCFIEQESLSKAKIVLCTNFYVLLKTIFMLIKTMIVLLNKNFYHNKAMFMFVLSNIDNSKFVLQNKDCFIENNIENNI